MSWIADQLAASFDVIEQAAGDPGTIRRGSNTTPLESIVIGQVNHKGTDAGGQMIIVSRKIDILIRPTKYTFAGEAMLPALGDRITVGDRSFVVVADDENKCWRFSDGFKTFLRIHVDEV